MPWAGEAAHGQARLNFGRRHPRPVLAPGVDDEANVSGRGPDSHLPSPLIVKTLRLRTVDVNVSSMSSPILLVPGPIQTFEGI